MPRPTTQTCALPLAFSVQLALLALLPACSDGSGTGSTSPPSSTTFELTSVSIEPGDVIPLNRVIELAFSADVDVRSVSPATVEVIDSGGAPVLGAYTLTDPRTVRFEPACPTVAEAVAGGLEPGSAYTLRVPSTADGFLALQDTAGRALGAGATVAFRTPDSLDPSELYDDAAAGPPGVRILDHGPSSKESGPVDSGTVSYIEFTGEDADGDGAPDRMDLAWDPALGTATIGRDVPLNLYSQPDQRFAFVLRFDQPVDPRPVNLARVRLEHRDSAGADPWRSLPAARELVSNCASSGAILRLEPLGVLPGGHELRVSLDAAFSDLVGETRTADFEGVARVRVAPVMLDGVADEIIETFDGTELFDPSAQSALPLAEWDGSGSLSASFAFAGTGGPGGDFDWVVRANDYVTLNTDADTILGGPQGLPTTVQPVIGGLVQVRNLTIEPGAIVRVVGSSPLTILATGDVRIGGWLRVDGIEFRSVSTIDTTNQPEVGAAGVAGGGDGGIGSPRVDASSERGGPGEGAFGLPAGGGQGGETGYALNLGGCGKENRRGAGGGGGRFGPDVRYDWNGARVLCQTLVGMDAERGFVGSFEGTGAVSQNAPAQGGAPGPVPFVDGDDGNNFLGVVRRPDGTTVRGELTGVWAGAGGGGGGDAAIAAAWPALPFSPAGDEKGAGGGGGAGGIEILALGDIEIEPQGSISADGGHGGAGESTIFFDRVGGGSGGGSGGHIVLASAGRVILRAEAAGPTVGAFYSDALTVLEHVKRPLRALGGQGGAGRQSRCGANEEGPVSWVRDSIPLENFEGDPSIPPQDPTNPDGLLNWARLCSLQNHAGCASEPPPGETYGAGGDGGPGLIQIHVANPATDLVLGASGGASGAYGAGGDPTFAAAPPPLGWTGPGDPVSSPLPMFGSRSEAVTRWIPLGLARPDSARVELLFGGTDPDTGLVLRDGDSAAEQSPLVAYTPLGSGAGAPSLDVDRAEVTFPNAQSFDPTGVYRRNPALMRGFAVRLRNVGASAGEREFTVQSAGYDESSDALIARVDPRGSDLADAAAGPSAPEVELVPFFLRLKSEGELDAYPAGSEVRVLFDAARIDPATGLVSTDPASVFSGNDPAAFTPDITDLNQSDWDVLRIRFEFLLGTSEPGAPRPGIDLLKVPYTF